MSINKNKLCSIMGTTFDNLNLLIASGNIIVITTHTNPEMLVFISRFDRYFVEFTSFRDCENYINSLHKTPLYAFRRSRLESSDIDALMMKISKYTMRDERLDYIVNLNLFESVEIVSGAKCIVKYDGEYYNFTFIIEAMAIDLINRFNNECNKNDIDSDIKVVDEKFHATCRII